MHAGNAAPNGRPCTESARGAWHGLRTLRRAEGDGGGEDGRRHRPVHSDGIRTFARSRPNHHTGSPVISSIGSPPVLGHRLYGASVTGSSQRTAEPSTFSWMAMWLIAVGVAPCQFFSPGTSETTSPGRISSIAPPSRCAQPQPAVTISVWPSGGVPGGPGAGLERDAGAGCACRGVRLEQRVYTHRAGKPIGRSLARRL